MNTVAQPRSLADAEEYIRSSLESKVKELFPDRDEVYQRNIVNAAHDAFCLRGSSVNHGLENLIGLGVTLASDQRALEDTADTVLNDLRKQGLTAMDMSSIQMLRWYD